MARVQNLQNECLLFAVVLLSFFWSENRVWVPIFSVKFFKKVSDSG